MELRGDLPGDRRELRIQVGPFRVTVTETPGVTLTDREWDDIQLARRSYTAMWGGDGRGVVDDPLDGRDAQSCYRAWHYRAWIRDEMGAGKLVTMRKAGLVPAALSAKKRADPGELLPLDIRFWRVRTGPVASQTGPGVNALDVPLWAVLSAHARSLAPNDEDAQLRIAVMGRIAAFPHGEPKRTVRESERTAIAFTAIQLLAAHGDPSLLYVWSLCPELQDRVVGVRDIDGLYVAPDFRRTEDVLGLPVGSISMDDSLPEVREHKASYPGYFIDNDDAAGVVAGLLDDGLLTLSDLGPSIGRLIVAESADGRLGRQLEEVIALLARPDHRRLAKMLTSSRLFKYLGPLMAGKEPLSRLPAGELTTRLLRETGDGPFSATVSPAEWATSAWAVLDAAAEKYGEATRCTRPTPAPVAAPTDIEAVPAQLPLVAERA